MGWVYFRKMFGSNVKLSGLKDFSLVCYKQFLQTLKASDYTVLSLVEFIERERNIDKNEWGYKAQIKSTCPVRQGKC